MTCNEKQWKDAFFNLSILYPKVDKNGTIKTPSKIHMTLLTNLSMHFKFNFINYILFLYLVNFHFSPSIFCLNFPSCSPPVFYFVFQHFPFSLFLHFRLPSYSPVVFHLVFQHFPYPLFSHLR